MGYLLGFNGIKYRMNIDEYDLMGFKGIESDESDGIFHGFFGQQWQCDAIPMGIYRLAMTTSLRTGSHGPFSSRLLC